MTFRDRLISELTQLDVRESKRKGHNPYALAHYFRAADNVMEAIGSGASESRAFSDCFTATSGMHRVAKRLGLRLDVQRGEWIPLEGADNA